MLRGSCAALLSLVVCVVWLSACGAEKAPRSTHIASMSTETGYGLRDVSGGDYLVARPRLNAQGTRLYLICNCGPAEAPWEVQVTEPPFRNRRNVTNNARNELAVIPSPDDTKLLLLVEQAGGRGALVVADTGGKDLATLAEGLDAARSQLAWSFDGAFVYYTAPTADGEGMGLYRVKPDGTVRERLVKDAEAGEYLSVDAFDACAGRDRVVALTRGVLQVLDSGQISSSFEVEGPVAGLCVSRDGTKAAWGGERIVVVSLETGKAIARSSPPEKEAAFDREPAWSPDGSQVAFERAFRLGGRDGPVLDAEIRRLVVADGSEIERFRETAWHEALQWTPDGKEIVYESGNFGSVYAKAVELPPPAELRPAPEGLEWHKANGPYGGWVQAYAVAPSDGRVVYALVGDVMYTTSDAGESWRRLEKAGEFRTFSGVSVDAADARVVYACPGGGKLLRSADGGETWADFGPKRQARALEAVTAHPTKPGVVFAVSVGGTAVLRYEGETVTELYKGEQPVPRPWLVVDRHNPDLLVLASHSQLNRFSSDGGKNWHEPTPPAGERRIAFLAGSATDPEIVLAQTESGAYYYTQDNGTSWDRYADPSDPALWTEAIRATIREAFPLRNADGGLRVPRNAWWWMAVADPSKPGRVYVPTYYEGLYRSDDGGETWQPANRELGVLEVQALLPVPGESGRVVIAGGDGAQVTANSGETWQPSEGPELRSRAFLAAQTSIRGLLFMGDIHGAIQRSTDGGATWEEVAPTNLGGPEWGWGRCFRFDPEQPDVVYFYATGGVRRSTDQGKTWKTIAQFKPPFGSSAEVGIAASGPMITMGGSWHDRRLFQTRDLGKTWRLVEGPHQVGDLIAVFGRPDRPGAVAVLGGWDDERGSAVLFVSDDAGETWAIRPLPKSGWRPVSIVRNPAAPDMLAVGLPGGVLVSPDDGVTWLDVGTGLPEAYVTALAFSPADGRLYVFLSREGTFWTELPRTQ